MKASDPQMGSTQSDHSKWWTTGVISLLILFLIKMFFIPAFDFDESIYVQMAKEMHVRPGLIVVPTWDSTPYHHKPPFYLWVIEFFWELKKQVGLENVSGVARLFSFFCLLASGWVGAHYFPSLTSATPKGPPPPSNRFANRFKILMLFSLLSPYLLMGSSLILLDPLLCFFLLLTYMGMGKKLQNLSVGQTTSTLSWGMIGGVAGATAVKGLIGVVLPMGGLVCYLIFSFWNIPSSKRLSWIFQVAKCMLPSLVLGSVMALFYYGFIYLSGGKEFVIDFFWVHHFGRSTTAMEGHSGPIWTYLLVMILSGGPLVWIWNLFLAQHLRRASFKDLPASFQFLFGSVFFIICFFSLLATKLPNYIWPALQLFPVMTLILLVQNEKHFPSQPLQSSSGKLIGYLVAKTSLLWKASVWVVFAVLLSLLAIAFLISTTLIPFSFREKWNWVLGDVSIPYVSWAISLLVIGMISWRLKRLFHKAPSQQWNLWHHYLLKMTALHLSLFVILLYIMFPWILRFTHSPLQEVTKYLVSSGATEVGTLKLMSPTFSNYFFPGTLRQHTDEGAFQYPYVVTYVWKKDVCEKNHYQDIKTVHFYIICKR